MAQERQGQTVPVRLYQTVDHIMLVAPMPGLEPANIFVVIDSNQVTVRGEERGPRQHELNLLIEEWAFGPYYREVLLPQPVNADLCNATYGNGVLTLSMPKLVAAKAPNYAAFGLVAVTSTFGERVGHSGHNIQPTTTREHQQKVDRTAGRGSEYTPTYPQGLSPLTLMSGATHAKDPIAITSNPRDANNARL